MFWKDFPLVGGDNSSGTTRFRRAKAIPRSNRHP